MCRQADCQVMKSCESTTETAHQPTADVIVIYMLFRLYDEGMCDEGMCAGVEVDRS